jgi:outer membrane protein TolC
MNVFNKRVSRLEAQLARCAENEQQDRSIVEAILENRRRLLGLPPEKKQPLATPLRASHPESIAEAIWHAQAARKDLAKIGIGQE